jgi:hypothetical protein
MFRSSQVSSLNKSNSRSEGPASKSSYVLGDPPPDPRFLASLGSLSLVELDHCCVVDLTAWAARKDLLVVHRLACLALEL